MPNLGYILLRNNKVGNIFEITQRQLGIMNAKI